MNIIKFANFISYLTVLFNQSDKGKLSEFEIEVIRNHINDIADAKLITPNVNLIPMFDFILAGKRIDAIKEHRRLTGMGLRESKDEIERLIGGPWLGDILNKAINP